MKLRLLFNFLLNWVEIYCNMIKKLFYDLKTLSHEKKTSTEEWKNMAKIALDFVVNLHSVYCLFW